MTASAGGPPSRAVVRVAVALLVWLLCAGGSAAYLFWHDEREVVLATHDARVSPSVDRHVVLHTGPVLPDVRLPTEDRIGVDIWLDKTTASSTDELLSRYGFIASNPDGQVDKVRAAVRDMVLDAALRGALIGLLPLVLWWLLGATRRREIGGHLVSRTGITVVTMLAVGALAWWRPWAARDEPPAVTEESWLSLRQMFGIEVPDSLGAVEVRGGAITAQTRRLVESALSTYDSSKTFYDDAATTAADLDLRQPEGDETVVLFVSDRHDNIGMDRVARAVGERAGASALFNGGDDTSTGEPWEAFSLDSVSEVFDDWPRYSVVGNHDHGSFVGQYLAERGWTRLEGEVVDGPGATTVLGVDDPRSSGLGNWRDESGRSFSEVAEDLAETACAADEPVSTILVHDANLGREAVRRGCAQLVIGGHTHVVKGPEEVLDDDGARAGYAFTTGTAGGAAYAIAMGSKPRRPAELSLLTYDGEGRPVGVQVATLQTDGSWQVGEFRSMEW